MTTAIEPAPILPPSAIPDLHAEEQLVGYWRDCKDPASPNSYPAKRAADCRATIERLRATGSTGHTVIADRGQETQLQNLERMLPRYEAEVAAQAALPWPGDHVDPTMPEDERAVIAAALDAGEEVAGWMGSSWDRLDQEAHPILGSQCLALNGYRWPSGLSHYVRRYGLRLSPKFLAAIGALSDCPDCLSAPCSCPTIRDFEIAMARIEELEARIEELEAIDDLRGHELAEAEARLAAVTEEEVKP